MIPSLVANDVARSLREFISTGFETDTWPFAGKFEQLVNTQSGGEAFLKGPYVSIALPFLKEKSASREFFPNFKTEHSPFVHQQQGWNRLLRVLAPVKPSVFSIRYWIIAFEIKPKV
jgi:DEAD/DEAH box helicase domain-containing protein